jgi:hypothetical protein
MLTVHGRGPGLRPPPAGTCSSRRLTPHRGTRPSWA